MSVLRVQAAIYGFRRLFQAQVSVRILAEAPGQLPLGHPRGISKKRMIDTGSVTGSDRQAGLQRLAVVLM
jgi:hypothetical protein